MFERVTERNEGRSVHTYRVTCGQCGVSANLGQQTMGQELAKTQVPKKFAKKGWSIGSRPADDRCPACTQAMLRRKEPKLTVVPTPEPALSPLPHPEDKARLLKPLTAEDFKPLKFSEELMKTPIMAELMATVAAKREMTRDERRLIFAKLDNVFLDEKRGYDDGWTDHRVAEDLGVPKAWVAQIRDENFGPENRNEAATALIADVAELNEQIGTMFDRINKAALELDGFRTRFEKEMADLKSEVRGAIRKGADLTKAVERIEGYFGRK
jgi:hypothetical protein